MVVNGAHCSPGTIRIADTAQPVVPIAAADQRQSMWSVGGALFNRPAAVLKHCRMFDRDHRLKVDFGLSFLQCRSLKKRRTGFQNIHVSRFLYIMANDIWKPQQVV